MITKFSLSVFFFFVFLSLAGIDVREIIKKITTLLRYLYLTR